MLTVTNRSNDKVLAHIPTNDGDVGEAVKSGREAKEAWGKMQGHIRARHLYRLVLAGYRSSLLFACFMNVFGGCQKWEKSELFEKN